jgi:hypothetical protein
MTEVPPRYGKVSKSKYGNAGAPHWPVVSAALLLVAMFIVARGRVLTGQETFFLRDLGTTHRPAAVVFAQLGFARTNPYASFGQPFLGNPNLLVAYPFPKSAGISIQIVVHLALCFAGMFVLLRRMATSPEGAFLAASAFTLSGYVLSATASLNAVTTIAWVPWLLVVAEALARGPLTRARCALAVVVIAFASLGGEPVLLGIALLIAAALAGVRGGRRALARLVLCGIAAGLLTLPVHIATVAAAMDSARVRLGFTFANAASASFHPARLAEILVPYFFGDPSRLVAGAWWGYAVSGGMQPYIYSAAFGLIPLLLATIAGAATRFRAERFWWGTALVCFILSLGGHLPGAEWAYSAFAPLHAIRFPIKFYLFTTLALAILAGRSFDYLAAAPPLVRRRAVQVLAILSAVTFAAAFVVRQNATAFAALLARTWWNPNWRTLPDVVLQPILESLPGRLVIVACMTFALLVWIGRRRGALGHLSLLVVVLVELTTTAGPLLPTIPATVVRQPSALVLFARAVRGPIFERTEKDLEPVVFGLKGRYADDDVRQLAGVQARQAWALSGAAFGIRYAFDPCPDGSYTMRNQRIEDLLALADWPRRLKWLRSAGVAGVISSAIPADTPGLRVVYREAARETGIPTTLYAVSDRLPEVRRVHRIVVAHSIAESVRIVERADVDPRDTAVIETSMPPTSLDGGNGDAHILRETADEIEIETSGDAGTFLFLARSFTSRLRALVNGGSAHVFPANVHLTAIPVPSGRSIVVVSTR